MTQPVAWSIALSQVVAVPEGLCQGTGTATRVIAGSWLESRARGSLATEVCEDRPTADPWGAVEPPCATQTTGSERSSHLLGDRALGPHGLFAFYVCMWSLGRSGGRALCGQRVSLDVCELTLDRRVTG